jgi:hypothetical protein
MRAAGSVRSAGEWLRGSAWPADTEPARAGHTGAALANRATRHPNQNAGHGDAGRATNRPSAYSRARHTTPDLGGER